MSKLKKLSYSNFETLTEETHANHNYKKLNIQKVSDLGSALYEKGIEFFKDGNEELAYISLMRFLNLILQYRTIHPEEEKKLKLKSEIRDALNKCEDLKESLKLRYAKEADKLPKENKVEKIQPPENPLEKFLKVKTSFISCSDLYNYTTKYNGNFFVIDVRKSEDFNNIHISLPSLKVCNIPNIHQKGLTAVKIKNQITDLSSKGLWDKRGSFDLIIIYGDKSDDDSINLLSDFLSNWEMNQYNIRILKGGISEWLLMYPNNITGSNREVCLITNGLDKLNVEPVEYPDFKNNIDTPTIDRTCKPSLSKPNSEDTTIHVNKMNQKNKLNSENVNKLKPENNENISSPSFKEKKDTFLNNSIIPPQEPIKRVSNSAQIVPSRDLKPSNSQPQLKRSYSSPNIHQQDKPKIVPEIDRSTKKTSTFKITKTRRNFSPVDGTMSHGLTGLKNLGNTCYMNSIIQCLNNIKPLSDFFLYSPFEKFLNSSQENEFAHEVAQVFYYMSYHYRTISLVDLRNLVGRRKKQFATNDQQDSHEFFTIFMDWLQEDFRSSNKIEPDKDIDKTNSPELQWRQFQKVNPSFISELFYGQQSSTVKCLKCNEQSITYDVFSNLSLPLPVQNNCSIYDCLKLYLSGEGIVHGWQCPKCKAPRNATKRFDICRLPRVLVIHLNRFHNDGGICCKRQTLVNFPLENFEMTVQLTGEKKIYNLYSVSNHTGKMEGGHYTAYCRYKCPKQWFCFNDNEVTEISVPEVQTQAAYILFYCSID